MTQPPAPGFPSDLEATLAERFYLDLIPEAHQYKVRMLMVLATKVSRWCWARHNVVDSAFLCRQAGQTIVYIIPTQSAFNSEMINPLLLLEESLRASTLGNDDVVCLQMRPSALSRLVRPKSVLIWQLPA